MRPRIVKVQKVTEMEINMNNGVNTPRRNKSVEHSSKIYTYVFGIKRYIDKSDVHVYLKEGFKVEVED